MPAVEMEGFTEKVAHVAEPGKMERAGKAFQTENVGQQKQGGSVS